MKAIGVILRATAGSLLALVLMVALEPSACHLTLIVVAVAFLLVVMHEFPEMPA